MREKDRESEGGRARGREGVRPVKIYTLVRGIWGKTQKGGSLKLITPKDSSRRLFFPASEQEKRSLLSRGWLVGERYGKNGEWKNRDRTG